MLIDRYIYMPRVSSNILLFLLLYFLLIFLLLFQWSKTWLKKKQKSLSDNEYIIMMRVLTVYLHIYFILLLKWMDITAVNQHYICTLSLSSFMYVYIIFHKPSSLPHTFPSRLLKRPKNTTLHNRLTVASVPITSAVPLTLVQGLKNFYFIIFHCFQEFLPSAIVTINYQGLISFA